MAFLYCPAQHWQLAISKKTHPAKSRPDGAPGVEVPLPCVLEGGDLGRGAGTVFLGEENVVVLSAVEGRVEMERGRRTRL
jgi:hypothetical protein